MQRPSRDATVEGANPFESRNHSRSSSDEYENPAEQDLPEPLPPDQSLTLEPGGVPPPIRPAVAPMSRGGIDGIDHSLSVNSEPGERGAVLPPISPSANSRSDSSGENAKPVVKGVKFTAEMANSGSGAELLNRKEWSAPNLESSDASSSDASKNGGEPSLRDIMGQLQTLNKRMSALENTVTTTLFDMNMKVSELQLQQGPKKGSNSAPYGAASSGRSLPSVAMNSMFSLNSAPDGSPAESNPLMAQSKRNSNTGGLESPEFGQSNRRSTIGSNGGIFSATTGGDAAWRNIISPTGSFIESPMSASLSYPSNATNQEHNILSPSNPLAQIARIFRSKRKSVDVNTTYVAVLDMLYVATTIVTSIMLVHFLHPQSQVDFTAMPPAWYIVWILLVELFTGFWIFLRFRVRVRRGAWEVVDKPEEIAAIYTHSWFPLDLLTALPLEIIFIGWLNEGYYWLTMRHFLRYARNFTLGASNNPFKATRTWFLFASYCMSLALAAHIFASIFWSLSPEGTTYSDSLYWAVATMTSVGYGDIETTPRSRIYAVACMLSGIVMISTFTAFATSFLTSKDVLTQQQAEMKEMMDAMLQQYNIPWPLQKEVMEMFPTVIEKKQESRFQEIIEHLPLFLQLKLMRHYHAHLLRSISLFAKIEDENLVLQLSGMMEQRYLPPFEVIMEEGNDANELFFLVSGVVEIISRGMVVTTLRNGAIIGEQAMYENGKRNATVRTVTNCEFVVFQKQYLLEAAEVSPQLMDLISEETKRRGFEPSFSPPTGALPRVRTPSRDTTGEHDSLTDDGRSPNETSSEHPNFHDLTQPHYSKSETQSMSVDHTTDSLDNSDNRREKPPPVQTARDVNQPSQSHKLRLSQLGVSERFDEARKHSRSAKSYHSEGR